MWRSNNKLSWREGFSLAAILVFCHYERSEVIQKQVLLVNRLLLSLCSIAMTSCGQEPRASVELASRLPRRAFSTARNDKGECGLSNYEPRLSIEKWQKKKLIRYLFMAFRRNRRFFLLFRLCLRLSGLILKTNNLHY